jgi:FtsP/CotA-like multicopper oxidase with cupredoxin domain
LKVNRPEREDEDRGESKGYSLNGKVVIGIGLVMIAAAASTILAMAASQSSQIHLSTKKVFGTSLLEPVQVPPNTNEHIDKRFVLVQYDFGWNGTIGGPTIKVNKGDVIQITIINAGMMAHNFAIADFSQQTLDLLQKTMNMPLPDRVRYLPYNVMAVMPCPGCQPKFQEGQIDAFMQPATQQVTTFKATEVGDFKYFCQVRGHLWLGMVGDLDVVDTSDHGTQQVSLKGTTQHE